ncbi:MAG: arginine deiminase family protein [Pseudomonadota bacterium]
MALSEQNEVRSDTLWGITSETGVLRDVLLARPTHYRWEAVNAVAKATLDAQTPLDIDLANRQYDGLVTALEAAEVRCHFLDLEPGLAFQTFTRDSSQMTPWGAVINQLARVERRGEWSAVLTFYQQNDIPIWHHNTLGTLEGGDIHVIRPGLFLVGQSGVRTSREGAEQISGWFAAEGWETLIYPFPEHFLHLDVLFSMVAPDMALACVDALDPQLIDWLEAHGIKILPVSFRETMALGCNALALGGGRVVSPPHNIKANEAMREAGLHVINVPLDCFSRGGGSVHCLTQPLRRDPL